MVYFMNNNLISNYQDRMRRSQENKEKILFFLKTEIYSTAKILSNLLKFKTVSPIYSILKKMEEDKLIIKHEVMTNSDNKINLYGITSHGYIMTLDEKDNQLKTITFQPSKVSLSTLQHRLDIQKNRIVAENKNFEWRSLHNVKLNSNIKLPDALIRTDSSKVYAIEIERVAKSPKRYSEIINKLTIQANDKNWSGVIYLFPSKQLKVRIERIFSAIIGDDKKNIFIFKTYEDFYNE